MGRREGVRERERNQGEMEKDTMISNNNKGLNNNL